MSRATPITAHFSSGEISPLLYGRVDLTLWASGCTLMQNFIALPQGGATRRPGTEYIDTVPAPPPGIESRKAGLIPFVFSETQAYALCFSHLTIRFYYQQSLLLSGPSAYEIASPYDEDDLADIHFFQHMDVMYLVHPDYAPHKLSRTGHASWSLTAVNFTWAGSPGMPPEWGASNYPSCVAIYEDRTFWAGCPNQPLKLWASQTWDLENLTTGTGDTDGFERTVSASAANKIRWLEPAGRLIFGSLGVALAGGVASSLDPITPTNFRVDPQASAGTAGIQGRLLGSSVLFFGKHAKRLYQLSYDYTQDQRTSTDLTLRASHMLKGGAVGFDYSEDPYNLIWTATNEGLLMGLTYYPPESVIAWHRHITDGEVESVCVIPGVERDEVWLVVKRSLNGKDVRCIELMKGFDLDAVEDSFFVDCGLTYNGAATDTVSGLDHLEGETVAILADGSTHAQKVVSGGQIELDREASKVHVGLPYTSRLVTLPYEAGSNDGTAQGKTKQIHKVILSLVDTVGGYVGQHGQALDEILYRDLDSVPGGPIPLFTGKTDPISVSGGYVKDAQIEIRQDDPLPMTIVGIIPQLVAGDM